VLIGNIVEEGTEELREEFEMRSVETRSRRATFRDLG
jgi:hypothetical protein